MNHNHINKGVSYDSAVGAKTEHIRRDVSENTTRLIDAGFRSKCASYGSILSIKEIREVAL